MAPGGPANQAEEPDAPTGAILESAPDAVIGCDLKGMITSWDSTAERLFGYAAAEIVGRPIAALLPRERQDEFVRRCELVVDGARTVAWETERILNIGIRTPVSVTLAGFQDSAGAAVGLVAVFRDPGERRRYQRESRIAEILQESLIPSELPEIPGLRFACRYRPAAEVGGDWYDVIPLSDVRVGVAIGDVVGRGVRAASAMGQLRSALRIYALEGLSPGILLERLNQLLHRLGEGDFATLLYLALDPQSGVVGFASAGHLPPLLVPGTGAARYLQGGTSVPLGADPDALYADGGVELESGSTLLLYTDGLIESRRRDLEAGMDLLLAEVTRGPRELEPLMDHLLKRVPDDEPDDDVALLALRSLSE